MRLNFSRFFFTFSEKNILVGHIFSLCPINGKCQIFHKFFIHFFSKSAFDLDPSPTYGKNVAIYNFSERAFYYLSIDDN